MAENTKSSLMKAFSPFFFTLKFFGTSKIKRKNNYSEVCSRLPAVFGIIFMSWVLSIGSVGNHIKSRFIDNAAFIDRVLFIVSTIVVHFDGILREKSMENFFNRLIVIDKMLLDKFILKFDNRNTGKFVKLCIFFCCTFVLSEIYKIYFFEDNIKILAVIFVNIFAFFLRFIESFLYMGLCWQLYIRVREIRHYIKDLNESYVVLNKSERREINETFAKLFSEISFAIMDINNNCGFVVLVFVGKIRISIF